MGHCAVIHSTLLLFATVIYSRRTGFWRRTDWGANPKRLSLSCAFAVNSFVWRVLMQFGISTVWRDAASRACPDKRLTTTSVDRRK
jgi:hypothetical protein